MVLRRQSAYGLMALLAALFALGLLSDSAWAQPILEIEKTDNPDPVEEGEPLTYTVTISNVGTTDATGVVFADDLDPQTNFLSITTPAGTTCPIQPAPGAPGTATPDIFCNLGTLDNGETATITIQVEPTAQAATDGSVTNTAAADSAETNPVSDEESTTVTPDLSIVKADSPNNVEVGDLLEYTLTVTNQGEATAQNVTVIDDLPGEVEFVQADETQGDCDEQPENVVVCDLGDLEGSETATIDILVRVDDEGDGTITNTAEVFVQGVNEPIDEDTETTPIQDNNGGGGGGGGGGNGKNKGPNNGPGNGPGQYGDLDGDGDVDQDDEVIDAENDLDDETTDGELTDGDEFDDDSLVSATADEDGAEASTPGAVASAGQDPDELSPVTDPLGDVEDEIPTSGPLPNTGGTPLWVYALPLLGLLMLVIAVVRKLKGDG